MTKEQLLQNIKQLRTERKWTYQQTADKLGWSRQAYERMENNRIKKLAFDDIEKVAQIFEMTTLELIGYNTTEVTAKRLLKEAIQFFKQGQAKINEAEALLEQKTPEKRE